MKKGKHGMYVSLIFSHRKKEKAGCVLQPVFFNA